MAIKQDDWYDKRIFKLIYKVICVLGKYKKETIVYSRLQFNVHIVLPYDTNERLFGNSNIVCTYFIVAMELVLDDYVSAYEQNYLQVSKLEIKHKIDWI